MAERIEGLRARTEAARARSAAARARPESVHRLAEGWQTAKPPLGAPNAVVYPKALDGWDPAAYVTVPDVAAVTTHPSRDRHRRLVGANIRDARSAAGLSQTALGLRFPGDGKTQAQVSDWERGEHLPQPEHMEQIAAILGRPVSWFFVPHGDDPSALL